MNDPERDAFIPEALYATLTNSNFDMDYFIGINLRAGDITLRAMKMLKQAHFDNYGVPQPTRVRTGTVAGPDILVTGHSLKALEELLKQTDGTGVNVYTHSEMLSAHGYPRLKKYEHLMGNLGRAWFDQKKLFAEKSLAIVVFGNCVLIPKDAYKEGRRHSHVPLPPGHQGHLSRPEAVGLDHAERLQGPSRELDLRLTGDAREDMANMFK